MELWKNILGPSFPLILFDVSAQVGAQLECKPTYNWRGSHKDTAREDKGIAVFLLYSNKTKKVEIDLAAALLLTTKQPEWAWYALYQCVRDMDSTASFSKKPEI